MRVLAVANVAIAGCRVGLECALAGHGCVWFRRLAKAVCRGAVGGGSAGWTPVHARRHVAFSSGLSSTGTVTLAWNSSRQARSTHLQASRLSKSPYGSSQPGGAAFVVGSVGRGTPLAGMLPFTQHALR